MASGEDQRHQGRDCQTLLKLIGEPVVGSLEMPEEMSSLDGVGRNFRVHPFRRSSQSPFLRVDLGWFGRINRTSPS